MSLVEFINFSFKYSNSNFWSLKNINLKIEEGEFVLITGQSGCGKTTLLRSINGLIPHYHQGDYEGKVLLDGKEVSKHEVYELAKIAGIVFQNPEDQIFAMTVEKEIAFGLENMGYERSYMRKTVDEVMGLMRIEHLRYKQPFFLSGGEQQKVIIASILALKPKLLLLDEPLSSLDPISAKSLVEELARLNKEYKKTIIIAEHRLDLLSKYANRIIIMEKGEIILDKRIEDVICKIDLESLGINEPLFAKFVRILENKYKINLGRCLSIDELISKFNYEKNNRI
ncbi:MAG: ABC transporter ATP-binding protein [Thermoproteota archaeon]|jgi:energy-coupling factor transporter ATP-binding protein EcfA2|nr:ABC transporter ATP-binding protein [Thermoproteota archaeon]